MRVRRGGRGANGAVGRRCAPRWLAVLLLACLLGPGGALAQSAPAEKGTARPVGLDALLKLPDSTPTPTAKPMAGGATRDQWRLRFTKSRLELQEAELRLAEAQTELEKLASATSTWQVAAPGGGASTESGPLSYSLREQIRRSRSDIARAERALDELRVEANLAGVPAAWIADADPSRAPAGDDGGFQEPTP